MEKQAGSRPSLINSVGAPLENVVESAETFDERGPPPDDGTSFAVKTVFKIIITTGNKSLQLWEILSG